MTAVAVDMVSWGKANDVREVLWGSDWGVELTATGRAGTLLGNDCTARVPSELTSERFARADFETCPLLRVSRGG